MRDEAGKILQDMIDRTKRPKLIPVEKTASETPPTTTSGETPADILNMLKTAARELGDGKSDNPNNYTPVDEGVGKGPEPNTDPVAEASKGPELSSNIKSAVLACLEMPNEKTAALTGEAKRALALALPIALLGGAGAGYVGGRAVGEAKDRKNNQAYYEAGVYTAAQQLARQLNAEGGNGGQ